ncbi:MAG: hypothetical protein JWL91_658 [Sphingomonas bacterium]|nr:hypothetical protein [Sphingomonas bacterium]MDB5688782.1 hypothetical protein [Sphingomonas bacterium]
MFRFTVVLCAAALIAAPALAATPRETLAQAAFAVRDKPTALARIGQAEAAVNGVLARTPRDREANLLAAMAIGYRAKLNKSRSEAVEAGRRFAALAAADPRDAEAQAALGAWHLDAVTALGGMMAGVALGAKKATGLAAMDRAVALGGNRAMFAGLSALMRLALDPADAKAPALAEAASRGATPTPLDQIMQRAAAAVLVPLRARDTKQAAALARQLLPFGRIVG